jgi:hypothetical protein
MSPGTAPQIDPEIAATLGLDDRLVQRFNANLQAALQNAQLPFQQDMAQYGPELQQALQSAFDRDFGALQNVMTSQSLAALRGDLTPEMQNYLAASGERVGKQTDFAKQDAMQRLTQAGYTPEDGAWQEQMRQVESEGRENYLRTERDIRQMAQQQAQNMLQFGATSNRLAGTQVPGLPQTHENRLQTQLGDVDQQIAELQARIDKAPKGMASMLAIPLQMQMQNLQSQRGQIQNQLKAGPFSAEVPRMSQGEVATWMEGEAPIYRGDVSTFSTAAPRPVRQRSSAPTQGRKVYPGGEPPQANLLISQREEERRKANRGF